MTKLRLLDLNNIPENKSVYDAMIDLCNSQDNLNKIFLSSFTLSSIRKIVDSCENFIFPENTETILGYKFEIRDYLKDVIFFGESFSISIADGDRLSFQINEGVYPVYTDPIKDITFSFCIGRDGV